MIIFCRLEKNFHRFSAIAITAEMDLGWTAFDAQ